MNKILHIDIETFSEVDLIKTNVTKYSKDPSFQILMACYSIDGGEVETVDLMADMGVLEKQGQINKLKKLLSDPDVSKIAHNAAFEMTCFHNAWGIPFNPQEWQCTMVMAHYLNLPGSLRDVSALLNLDNKKMDVGKRLIDYFCKPCKPTKTNGGRLRNYPYHDLAKWNLFKEYCKRDVEAEMEAYEKLIWLWEQLPQWEKDVWYLDQKINKQGVKVDLDLINIAAAADDVFKNRVKERLNFMTQIENPNSYDQLKNWIREADPELVVESLDKNHVDLIINETKNPLVKQVLTVRKLLAKTSTAKYVCAQNTQVDGYLNNLFSCFGTQTNRWAGSKIQPHNLPKNKLEDMDRVRNKYLNKEFEPHSETVPYELSQLIRTIFIPEKDNIFVVMDFSAIEARIVAWLAGEKWVIEEFQGEGKIYEATAAKMYNITKESVDENQRSDGKTAVLACGFGGSVGAIKKFMPTWEDEKCLAIVEQWRMANPKIVSFWRTIEDMAKMVIQDNKKLKYTIPGETSSIRIYKSKGFLVVELPSGRNIYYPKPFIDTGKLGFDSIYYYSKNQTTRKWEPTETYGGKLTENIVQAIARDLLAIAMLELDKSGFVIRLHVHDEVVVEIQDKDDFNNQFDFDNIKKIMTQEEPWVTRQPWCKELPLNAEGFLTKYYKKG